MSSTNTIPSSVDCIILGTGLTNSIVAAACSRIGKTTLHLDKNAYYGDHWASFTFQQLVDWIKLNCASEQQQDCLADLPQELIDRSRIFCIDLCPRLLFSTGAMVDLLVKSNVSRYHEFKNNIRILSMVDNDEIHVIPCRRSEVFNSPLLTDLIDKRKLMKFVEQCIKFDPEQENSDTNPIAESADKPISDYLESQGLNNTLKQYIINSIAMVEPTETTKKACENIKKFMFSTERFGRSPFLFPLYGCGEFPQSFCRLSAVFGGIYCLNTQIDMVQMIERTNQDGDNGGNPKEKYRVKFSNNEQEVKSYHLVQDHEADFKLSRAILITKSSIVKNDDSLLSFLRIPPKKDRNDNLISLLELNASVMVCPPDMNIVYMWTRSSQSKTADCDLKRTVEKIFDKGSIIWSFYYHHQATVDLTDDLDYSICIEVAKKIFSDMYPDEEFLPRAPDPDEIIT